MKTFKFMSALVAGTLVVLSAYADNFSFTGNLTGDDDVQLFNFSVGSSSTVTLRTWSYAGGTNAAGTAIAEGGFDPILALFDSTGLKIGQNDDGGSAYVPASAVTGAFYDTYLSLALGAGDYTVSVMQFSNFAIGPNLSNGFDGSGTTNFVDVTNHARTSAWAFDVLNVGTASTVGNGTNVPDAGGSLLLLSSGLAALAFAKRFSK